MSFPDELRELYRLREIRERRKLHAQIASIWIAAVLVYLGLALAVWSVTK